MPYINEVLWLILVVINFSLILTAYRLWGVTGLFSFATISIILANVQALKQVTLFGMQSSMGDASYIGIYLISDILSENHGPKVARKLVGMGFFTLIATILVMSLSLDILPNSMDRSQASLVSVFSVLPRLALASFSAFLISQTYDILAYQFWRRKFPDYKYLWIRNNFSTLISQLIDNSIFTLIAFYGLFPLAHLWQMFIATCVLRGVISVMDTPFMYLAAKMKPKVPSIDR